MLVKWSQATGNFLIQCWPNSQIHMCINESSRVTAWIKQPSVHCVAIEIEIRVQCQWANTISSPNRQYKRQRGETCIMYHINSATNDLVLWYSLLHINRSILRLWIAKTEWLYFVALCYIFIVHRFVNRTQNTRTRNCLLTSKIYICPNHTVVYNIFKHQIIFHVMLAYPLICQLSKFDKI